MKSFYLKTIIFFLLVIVGIQAEAATNIKSFNGIYYVLQDSRAFVTYSRDSWVTYKGDIVIPEKLSYYDIPQQKTLNFTVVSINDDAFKDCTDLTSITIPKSVTYIGNAFSGCSGLTRIVVNEDNSVYDSRDNCNAIIQTQSNCLIRGCNNTRIPESVTSIGPFAFSDCIGISYIPISDQVTSIGDNAFQNCCNLKLAQISKSVTTIGSNV